MGSGTARVNESQFIYLGMTKDKWPCLTPETIANFIVEPHWLDDMENNDFVECFYYYYDWYWSEQRSKQGLT